MNNIGEKIKEYRMLNCLSLREFAEKVGLSHAYISKLEKGYDPVTKKPVYPTTATMEKLSFLNFNTVKRGVKIPVLGKVQAGLPIEAIEYILDYEEITEDMASTGDYFALQIKGDSMEPRIKDGDVVIVRKQPDVENGEIGVIIINGCDATIKRVVKHKDGISLIAFNQVYIPKFYTNNEIFELPVTILGKVVELRGKF